MQISATSAAGLTNAFRGRDDSAPAATSDVGQAAVDINAITQAVFRVNLNQDARANVAAIRAADAAEGTLLDVIA